MSARELLGPRLPTLVDTTGPLRPRRVWPDRHHRGGLVVEATRSGGGILAAVVHPDGTAEVVDHDPRLPGLDSWRASAGCRLVAHRAGRRAVLAITAADAADRGGAPGPPSAPVPPSAPRADSGMGQQRQPARYAKLARPGASARAARVHDEVAARIADIPAAPRLPQLLDRDAASGVLVLGALPGRSLSDWLIAPDPAAGSPPQVAARVGRAVGGVVSAFAAAPTGGAELPRHGLDDELDVTSGWVREALDHDVVRGPWRRLLERAWEDVASRLAALEPVGSVLTHRDLHDGQVLLDWSPPEAGAGSCEPGRGRGDCPGGGQGSLAVGVLDLDTAALADPGLDLANLLAHLDLLAAARPGGSAPRLSTAVAAGVSRGLADALRAHGHPALDADPARVETLRDASRVRLAAVHAFRPAAADTVPALLAPWQGRRPTITWR